MHTHFYIPSLAYIPQYLPRLDHVLDTLLIAFPNCSQQLVLTKHADVVVVAHFLKYLLLDILQHPAEICYVAHACSRGDALQLLFQRVDVGSNDSLSKHSPLKRLVIDFRNAFLLGH